MPSVRTPPSIVVGIDGSSGAVHAAVWAIEEAVSRDIPLRLLYAIDPDRGDVALADADESARALAAAEHALQDAILAVESTGAAVKIETEIVQAPPLQALLRASRSAVMVCIGSAEQRRGHQRVTAIASALSAGVRCAVAVIRGPHPPAGTDPRCIVVDTDPHAQSSDLLATAVDEACLRAAPLQVLTRHAATSQTRPTHLAHTAHRPLPARSATERMLGRARQRHRDLRVESVPEGASLVDYVAAHADDVQLVVARGGLSPRLEEITGPAGHALLHHTDSSVLLIAPPRL